MHPIASLRRWMAPAPDSAVADALRAGKSPWSEAVHLLWTVWVFLTPLFGPGFTARWAVSPRLSCCWPRGACAGMAEQGLQ